MISPIQDLETLKKLMKMLSVQFGPKSEFVLHDLTHGYESTIIAIENNALTDRNVGDCGSNLGLEVLKSGKSPKEEDSYGYTIHLKDGRIFRSSTIYFYNDQGEVTGALCINTDITGLQEMADHILPLLPATNTKPVEEQFAHNVLDLLDFYIEKCDDLLGHKAPEDMTKEDKLSAIRYLDANGVFLITKSGSKVCKYLHISKGTLYSYLDIVREQQAGSAGKD